MRNMTPDECRAFMRTGTRTGKLATVRKDGSPHCVPVWCGFDGDCVLFTTMESSVKARNILRDNRVALTFDSEVFPFEFVMVEGRAEFVETTDEQMLHIATAIASRYVPEELAEAYGKRNAVPGERLVRVTPTRLISATGVAE